jgi:hypothetical protein
VASPEGVPPAGICNGISRYCRVGALDGNVNGALALCSTPPTTARTVYTFDCVAGAEVSTKLVDDVIGVPFSNVGAPPLLERYRLNDVPDPSLPNSRQPT